MSTVEQRVAALELDVKMLKTMFLNAPTATSTETAPKTPQQGSYTNQELDDSKLSESWADKEIRKDPPMWIQDGGESFVGRTMSACSPEYLDALSAFFEWKAAKGREEDPPKVNNKGKPWHEIESLNAKLARLWARHKRKPAGAQIKAAPTRAEQHQEPDEDIPF